MVQYGRPSCSFWAESIRSSFGRTILGKAIWENLIETWVGEGFQIENVSLFIVKEGLLLSVFLDDIKFAGKKQNLDPMWKVLNKEVDLGEPTSFLDHVYWGCAQRQCQISKDIVTITEPRSNREFPREEQRNCHSLKTFVFLHGLLTRKVKQRNVWSDVVCLQIRRLNNSTKYLLPASMTTTSKKKEICWSVTSMLPNCSEMLIPGTNWKTWCSVVSAQSITKWTKACDKRLNRLTS